MLVPLDDKAVAAGLKAAYDDGFRSVSVVCLHGYRYPEHEVRIGEIASRTGFTQVSLSPLEHESRTAKFRAIRIPRASSSYRGTTEWPGGTAARCFEM